MTLELSISNASRNKPARRTLFGRTITATNISPAAALAQIRRILHCNNELMLPSGFESQFENASGKQIEVKLIF